MLLAIVILSSVMAISFSLATILFIEVRTSGDLLKTEGALYAAGGVGEEAFFNIKRQVPYGTYTTNFSNNVKLSGSPVVSHTSTPIVLGKVAANSTLGSSGQKIYDFCSISASSGGCGYGKVDITYLDTGGSGSIKVYLCEFNPSADFSGSDPCSISPMVSSYWKVNGVILNKDDSTRSYTFTDAAKQQVLYITNYSSTADAYFQIKTYQDIAGLIPKGLPYVGKTAVDVATVNTSVGRKIRVIVPNGNDSPASPTDTVWVEDGIPTGGVCGNDAPDVCPWNKVSSNPAPFGGSFAFQSGIGAVMHQMFFQNSTNRLTINAGDVMFAYVYIDPANVPSEIMLQWNSMSQGWNHRAYWGANNLTWGTNGTQSRYQVSASLPASGGWVKLTVPASAVGLEGQTAWGMAFSLFGGRATWDRGGKTP